MFAWQLCAVNAVVEDNLTSSRKRTSLMLSSHTRMRQADLRMWVCVNCPEGSEQITDSLKRCLVKRPPSIESV